MAKKVTINLFDVGYDQARTPRLSDTIREFEKIDLEDRWRNEIRLESIQTYPADDIVKSKYYILDFSKKRQIGPGRFGPKTPLKDVHLAEDEAFGEETTALYLPKEKWMMILHSQYGIGPARMAEYFNLLNLNGPITDYTITPKIDRLALKRMQDMKSLTSVEVVANVGAFEQVDGKIAESAEEAAQEAKAMRLSIKLDANTAWKRGNSLNVESVKKLLLDLLKKSDDVQALRIKGSSDEAEKIDQTINLLEQKINAKRNASELKVVNHRYTHASKVDLLKRVCRGWTDTLS